MKILLATAYDYPHLGGLSVHLTTLKAGLEARGHEVDIVSFTDVPKWKRDFIVRGPAFLKNKKEAGSGYVYSLEQRSKELKQIIQQKVKEKKYDVINAQDVYTTFAALPTGIPVASTVHGYLTFEGISKGTVPENSKAAETLTNAEREAYRATSEIITVDTRIKDYIQEMAGVEGTAIRNFIDVHAFKPKTEQREALREQYKIAQDEFVFFVPRRLTKKNGVIYPILSLPAVLQEHPRTRVIFAGTGEMMDEMKAKAEELGIDKQVSIIGAVDHAEILNYYSLANAVIIPSIYSAGVEEATSISALEGMGSGVPVIASAVGGLKEIIEHGKDGLLVEEKSIEGLSDAMVQLIDDVEAGEALAQAARQKIVDHYSHLAAAASYEAIYEKAINK